MEEPARENHEYTETCPLCGAGATEFFKRKALLYYSCRNCLGIFMAKHLLPSRKAECDRYSQHNNDINDLRYQNFVAPITNAVFVQQLPFHEGLDFGAGPGPVVAKVLLDRGYQVKLYDPFFHDNPELLLRKYDYIICCEVIEHFHDPAREFDLLKRLLKPGGRLYCMTDLFSEQNFAAWYYKDDCTHVFFYRKETLLYIEREFRLRLLVVDGRLIVYENG